MVSISTKGYNVAKVGVNGVIDADTLTVVGSKKDYLKIFEFAQTGYLILRCKFKKSGVTLLFDGSVDCVISENESEIFFSTITEGDGAYQTLAGKFVLSSDKCKFTISEDELGGGITVDSAMSDSSENPVQNKVIKGALDDITELIPSDASTSNKLATKADVDKGYVEYVSDGTKTFGQALLALYNLHDKSKVNHNSKLLLCFGTHNPLDQTIVFHCEQCGIEYGNSIFTNVAITDSGSGYDCSIDTMTLSPGGTDLYYKSKIGNTSVSDYTNESCGNATFRLYY